MVWEERIYFFFGVNSNEYNKPMKAFQPLSLLSIDSTEVMAFFFRFPER